MAENKEVKRENNNQDKPKKGRPVPEKKAPKTRWETFSYELPERKKATK